MPDTEGYHSCGCPDGRDIRTSPNTIPTSVLIVGSGVFGLSTALSLAQNTVFAHTSITVVDRSPEDGIFPSPDAASIDTSRIIRPDYKDPLYARLAAEAQLLWRDKSSPAALGSEGRYHEAGLVLVANSDSRNASYVRESFENACALAAAAGHPGTVRLLDGAQAIRDRARTGGGTGTWGYVNETSGWADAAASMRWLFAKVRDTGRVRFVNAKVARLSTAGNRVTGAVLADGRALNASLVIAAAGAWTGELVELTGMVCATAQVLAFLPLSDEEQQTLAAMPVVLDISTGYFVIPPSHGLLKLARHTYGYQNPTAVSAPLPMTGPSNRTNTTTAAARVSLPWTSLDDPEYIISLHDSNGIRAALREMVPIQSLASRPFIKTRLCWYADTPTGDFLVDYHPRWEGLFLATGDSGHAFKFLPILGDKVIECILRSGPSDMRHQWSWANNQQHGTGDNVTTEDGSRAGKRGQILKLAI